MKYCTTKYVIFMGAFIARLLVLLLIILFSDSLGKDYNQNAANPDDRRYVMGAIAYADTAKAPIDIDAFTKAYIQYDDYTGLNLDNWFRSTPLWYWITCVTIYVLKTEWSIRLLNIVFASLTSLIIYEFSSLVLDRKTARKAALLYSFLPYTVFFSCFAYKDQMVSLFSVFLVYESCRFRYGRQLFKDKAIYSLMAIIAVVVLVFTRGPVGVMVSVIAIAYALGVDNFIKKGKIVSKYLLRVAGIFTMGSFTIVASAPLVLRRLDYYLNGRVEDVGEATIQYLLINSPLDIYKLPITYMFSIISPIDLFKPITSWLSVIDNLNIVMIPIAAMSFLYLFHKKYDCFIYWTILIIYIATIVTSLNITRHYYSLLPFTLIGVADYMDKAQENDKLVCYILTISMFIAFILFYGRKAI